MFKHNLLVIYRSFKRHKSTFFINLIGLTTSLTCAFLIWLWIQDELGVDKFHAHDTRLFQVMEKSEEGGKVVVHDNTQGLLGQSMAKDLPEVEAATSVLNLGKHDFKLPITFDGKSIEQAGIFASSNFFDVFSFPLKAGQASTVFSDRNALVISENLAQTLFGSAEKAVGQTLHWEFIGKKRQSQVSGVFAALPPNSSLQFDFIGSYETLLQELWPSGQSWGNEGVQTYLLLKPGVEATGFNEKIAGFVKNYRPETIFTCFVRPFSSGYLYGKYENGVQAGGRINYVKLFGAIALFILLIACINFMNLSTAKSSARVKEIGIKKSIGSSRGNLAMQFLTEAMLISMLATVLAMGFSSMMLPVFNTITGKSIAFPLSGVTVALALGTALITGLLAGSYPAFHLSGFQPVSILKGQFRSSAGEYLARRTLVVFQFVVSLVLIFAVGVIYLQIDFVQSQNLGYNRTNVLSFNKTGAMAENQEALLAEIRQIPGVERASAMQESMVQKTGIGGSSTYGIDWPGKSDKDLIDFNIRAVDFDLIELLELPIVEGRSFSRSYSDEQSKLLFNETAIRQMGLTNPVGQSVIMWGEPKIIAGVVKDFHLTSLHEPIAPMVFRFSPKQTSSIMVKIRSGEEQEALSKLAVTYQKFNPGLDFNFTFLDDAYQALYVTEQRISILSKYFAGLAILISCLGLFGLSMFTAEQRTKEVGIRKALGATLTGITVLLTRDFMKLVAGAIAIAFPIAYYLMQTWLTDFAYRIDIPWWMFVSAGVAALVIAFLTVSIQSIKAALANPIKSLRSE